jgi:MFS family permease
MYIYSYYPNASFSATQEIFPIMMIIGPISNFICAQLINRGVNSHLLIMIGAFMMIGGLFLCSIFKTFQLFFPMFAFSFGVSGFFYSIILPKGWMYFPGYEGAVSGTIIAGFGIGGFIANALVAAWLNPENIDPDKFDKDDPS